MDGWKLNVLRSNQEDLRIAKLSHSEYLSSGGKPFLELIAELSNTDDEWQAAENEIERNIMMKAGILTTEFWMVVGAAILSVAVASGYISALEVQELTDRTAQVLSSGAELVSALTLLIGPVVYVWSRTRIKQNVSKEEQYLKDNDLIKV